MKDDYDGLAKPVQGRQSADDAEKLARPRARLKAGQASPLVEDFDPQAFLAEMRASYGRSDQANHHNDT